MARLKVLCFLIFLHGFIGTLHAADKYTDENRPYEFGFTIDGEQHRHEKKDENGIIMGEFGFITADGVYHVTVYATDENGRFKILSMKNIRVKPYPTAGGNVKKGHSIPFPPSENAPVLQGPSKTTKQKSNPIEIKKQIASPAKSCSHCSIPTTTTKAPPPQLTDIAVVSRDNVASRPLGVKDSEIPPQNHSGLSYVGQSFGNNDKTLSTPDLGQQYNPPNPNLNQNNNQYLQRNLQENQNGGQNYLQQGFPAKPSPLPNARATNYPQQNKNENPSISKTNQYYPQNQNNGIQIPQVYNSHEIQNPSLLGDEYNTQGGGFISQNNPQGPSNTEQNYNQKDNINNNINFAQAGAPVPVQPYTGQEPINSVQTPKDTLRNPKQYNDVSLPSADIGHPQGFGAALASLGTQAVADKPTLVLAQMQIVPKDTNIHHRNPGEEEGLPNGLSKDDMSNLLYTFNYTVGFHGHHEEGYSSGAKKGYYYVTGRNGIRTRVDYIADEKGFRPRISQEVLDILSDDVPKPETEKDKKFGLKGYEFKWLYYPVDETKH